MKTAAAKTPKKPRRITAQYLENAALYYLQRYATSSENLRRVLTRKVDRSCRFHDVPAEPFYPVIDALIGRYQATGLLNDTVYAEGRVSSLRRQGKSRQAIFSALQAKGLGKDAIARALTDIDAEKPDADLAAARELARRKKIGPWRREKSAAADAQADPRQRQKELAALARAGFSYDTAKRALEHGADSDDDFIT